MYEPPSQELVRQLTELQLCRPSDLNRARGPVRRLSYDLPAFDSVWIDALVQLRLLTPYQARSLELGEADRLRIGPFVVINELGRGHDGTTYLVQRLNRRDRRVLKRSHVPLERRDDVSRQMKLMLDHSKGFGHPHIVLPSEVLPSNERELITVSRYVQGLPLNELLVRRGRFPAAVVFEIGRQLLDGLAALHAKSLVHGDIRMSNVRLTDNGLAILVDAGIRRVVHPEVTIHDTIALEAYDGIAPELIGTGELPSASSELYALGCLLWQLLAGRPPYTTADPLAKLASHQTSTIDDVRTWAPDTPAMLAKSIRQMTSPTPSSRPRSFHDLLQQWGKPGSLGRSRLKQFRRLFDGDVPHFSRPGAQDRLSGGIWIAVLLFAASGAAGLMYDNGLRTELLEIVHHAKSVWKNDGQSPVSSGDPTRDDVKEDPIPVIKRRALLPFPELQNGVILLKENGPYEAARINFKGDLVIRSAAGVKPEIHISDGPLRLAAHTVLLDGVTLRRVDSNNPVALINVITQQLQVLNCEFLCHSADDHDQEKRGGDDNQTVSIAWRSLNAPGLEADVVVIKNTFFCGNGTALRLGQVPQALRISNSLKTGDGALISLEHKCQSNVSTLELTRVTLRETGPLLEVAGEPATRTGAVPLAVQANDCVFALADRQSGLITINAEQPRADVAESIEMTISNSVVSLDTALMTVLNPARNTTSPLPEEEIDEQFDGLQAGEIKFFGSNLAVPKHSKTAQIIGPRGSDDEPGIVPEEIGALHR